VSSRVRPALQGREEAQAGAGTRTEEEAFDLDEKRKDRGQELWRT